MSTDDTDEREFEDAGDVVRESIDQLENAFLALAARTRLEETFTADLQGGLEPTVSALETVGESFAESARTQLEAFDERSLEAADGLHQSAGTLDLLDAAVTVAEIPESVTMDPTAEITAASGARVVPWLEIVKEIIKAILDLFPGSGFLRRLIDEILDIIDKLVGGEPEPGKTRTRPRT